MKKLFYVLSGLACSAMLVTSCSSLKKMRKDVNEITYKVTPTVLEAKGGQVALRIDATIPQKYFAKKVILTATPMLKSVGGEAKYTSMVMQGEKVQGNNTVVPYKEGKSLNYSSIIPYTPEMRKSDLVVKFYGQKGSKELTFISPKIAEGVNSTAYLVNVNPKLAIAGDNFQRDIDKSKEGDIKYEINSSQIRRSEARGQEMKNVKEFLKEIKANERLKLNNVEIRSYASPDGALDFNEKVSKGRDKSSTSYVNRNFKKDINASSNDADVLKKYIVAEDWDGFKKALEASNIQDKDLILRVLSMYSDPEVREREIRNISSAFTSVAKDILPQLRRSRFIVNITECGKKDNEIKELIKNNPEALSLEELLYSVNLFDNDNEKLDIFDNVINLYPNDWRAYNDVAVLLCKQGSFDDSKKYFVKAKELSNNNPIVMNNLGALALRDNELNEAAVCFGAASSLGETVEYNKGILAILNGKYAEAVNCFKNDKSANAALANLLDGNLDVASSLLSALDSSADTDYLKAVVAARAKRFDDVMLNLNNAIEKNSLLKEKAASDAEFMTYRQNSEFISLTK